MTVKAFKASNGRETITVYGYDYGDALSAAISLLGIRFIAIKRL